MHECDPIESSPFHRATSDSKLFSLFSDLYSLELHAELELEKRIDLRSNPFYKGANQGSVEDTDLDIATDIEIGLARDRFIEAVLEDEELEFEDRIGLILCAYKPGENRPQYFDSVSEHLRTMSATLDRNESLAVRGMWGGNHKFYRVVPGSKLTLDDDQGRDSLNINVSPMPFARVTVDKKGGDYHIITSRDALSEHLMTFNPFSAEDVALVERFLGLPQAEPETTRDEAARQPELLVDVYDEIRPAEFSADPLEQFAVEMAAYYLDVKRGKNSEYDPQIVQAVAEAVKLSSWKTVWAKILGQQVTHSTIIESDALSSSQGERFHFAPEFIAGPASFSGLMAKDIQQFVDDNLHQMDRDKTSVLFSYEESSLKAGEVLGEILVDY